MTTLTTREAADRIGIRVETVRLLIGDGTLEAERDRHNHWQIDPASAAAEATRRHRWIGLATAARLVGCTERTIIAAANSGAIVRRPVQRRAAPSLLRSSVEAFARTWTPPAPKPRVRPASDPPDDDHEWIGTAEAAQLLGCSRHWFTTLARAEAIPAVRRGNRWWIQRPHLEMYKRARGAQLLRSVGGDGHARWQPDRC